MLMFIYMSYRMGIKKTENLWEFTNEVKKGYYVKVKFYQVA